MHFCWEFIVILCSVARWCNR